MDIQPIDEIACSLAAEPIDLTSEAQLQQLADASDSLLSSFAAAGELDRLEQDLATRSVDVPLLMQVAVKLARSKQLVQKMEGPHHISVVFAVYKESTRIQTRSENPHGENFLLRKIAQLEWLFRSQPAFSWELIVVDDGDPEQTGRLAEDILAKNHSGDNVRVLYLEEAIQQNVAVTHPMTSAQQSQKGGSIAYGMWDATQHEHPNHIVVFTDADLSTHLGQTGLLIDAIVNGGHDAAIGSRREELSIVVKQGVRNVRGKLFIYLWKRLISPLGYIVDTQCGFKAFTADTVRAVVNDLIEKKFAFDIELLLKTELRRSDSIARVPIAWIDSEAASTTTDLQPYLPMLQAVATMYRKYLPPNTQSGKFAEFVESLDQDQWSRLVENVPGEIADRDPAEFGSFDKVSVDDLRSAAR